MKRKGGRLSSSLERGLNMYALAASAAGVGMLALSQPAEARIVYTRANKVIPQCWRHPKLCFKLDLTRDGMTDFTIPLVNTYRVHYLAVRPASKKSNNAIWGTLSHSKSATRSYPVASALKAGVNIGANSVKFQPGKKYLWGYGPGCGRNSNACTWGQWNNVQNKYLGLKFYVKGKVHYGWARLSVASGLKAKLTGYAYETVANKAITTGKTKEPEVITLAPDSLGRLAQGSAGRARK
jgi:hypothetical protein